MTLGQAIKRLGERSMGLAWDPEDGLWRVIAMPWDTVMATDICNGPTWQAAYAEAMNEAPI